jgi:hypothetical protein
MNVADLDAADRIARNQDCQLPLFAKQKAKQSFPDRHTPDGNHAAGIRMAGHTNSQVMLHVLHLPGRLIFCASHPVATGEGQTRRFSKKSLSFFFSPV